jgi:hypothetical protein
MAFPFVRLSALFKVKLKQNPFIQVNAAVKLLASGAFPEKRRKRRASGPGCRSGVSG